MADLETRHFRAVLAVCDHGAFTAAARALGVTQPALSATIRQAEERVGLVLFERGPRRARPTSAGNLLQKEARRIMGDVVRATEMMRDLSAGRAGKLSIAALPSAAAEIVAPVLAHFHGDYPSIRITVRDALNQDVISQIRGGEADIGLCVVEPNAPSDGLSYDHLFDDHFIVVVPADHRLAVNDVILRNDLSGLPRIEAAPRSNTHYVVNRELGPSGDGAAIECSVVPTAIGLVRRGLGISVLSELACRPFQGDTRLAFRPLDPVVARPIAVVRDPRRPLSSAADLFLDSLYSDLRMTRQSGSS